MSCLCVASLMLLIGCSTAPSEPTPTLTDLRAVEGELERYEPPPLSTAPRAEADMRVLGFAIDADLSEAWALVDTEAFPPMTRGVWLANGLRLGVLQNAKLPAFLEELPPAVSSSQTQLIGYDLPTPLRRSPRLLAEFYADLTVPPFAPRREVLSGGRLQLLTRMMPASGFVNLELTPHHFKPKLSLEPRTSLEKQLDGRMFDELTVRVAMPADRVLILGYDLPNDARVPAGPEPGLNPPPETPQTPQTPETPETPKTPEKLELERVQASPMPGDVSQPPTLEGEGPPPVAVQALPLNLGRGLLTMPGRDRPLQLLLLIAVKPAE